MKKEDLKKSIDERRQVAQIAKESLINHILEQTEHLTSKQLANFNKKKESEIFELLGGDKISINQIKGIVAKAMTHYQPIFPHIFYKEIYRLNNWEVPKEKYWQKPHKVAQWTNELIYWRFPKEVLPTLQQLNPFIAVGIRVSYHYHWLTAEGKKYAEGFISDAVKMMQTCATWYEFRKKYAKEYGLPIQLKLWE